MANIPEWSKFKVGAKSTKANWTNPDCQPLDTVFHVTHFDSALRILSEGAIKSGLVYDKSKLNTERILVAWLSPNDWIGANGFRYGNVRFSFDFASLIKNKNIYWVESIPYGINAMRILITDNNYQQLTPYNPKIGDGPWWFDASTNSHYWNGDYCLEIMFESDLPVVSAKKIDFVKHHPNYCNIRPNSCPDRGVDQNLAGAKFLASLVGQHLNLSSLRWVDNNRPEDDLCYAWSWLKTKLTKSMEGLELTGTIPYTDQAASSIGRAILAAFSRGDIDEIKALSQLMKSKKAVIEACAKVISEDFEISERDDLEVI